MKPLKGASRSGAQEPVTILNFSRPSLGSDQGVGQISRLVMCVVGPSVSTGCTRGYSSYILSGYVEWMALYFNGSESSSAFPA